MAETLDSDLRPEVWTLTSELEGERASSFRQGRWCRVLIEAGFKVISFNIRGAFALSVREFIDIDSLEKFQNLVSAHARPMASVRQGPVTRIVRHIKHLLLIDLWLPNIWWLGWALHRRLRVGNGKVVLMASSPPFSVAVVAMIVKMWNPRVELVVDMRDAWALHTGLGGIRPLKRLIEKLVLRRSDRVLTVSHGLSREFSAVHGVHASVLYNVATHYFQLPEQEMLDWATLNSVLLPDSKKYVYTGSMPEGHFDVKAIVAGVRRAIRLHGLSARQMQLVFVGACDVLAREIQRQGGVEGVIIFVPHQPHRIARRVQRAADGLIFLAYDGDDNKGVVSTKFFEYLALGKPILPISIRRGSDVDGLLERFAGGSMRLLNEEQIGDALADLSSKTLALPYCSDPTRLALLLDEYRAWAAMLKSRISNECSSAI